MTCRVLTRKLRKLGCEFARQGPGSHEIWWNPLNKRFTTIPKGRGNIPKGTLAAILHDLGFTHKDLDST